VTVEIYTDDTILEYQFEVDYDTNLLQNTNVLDMEKQLYREISPEMTGSNRQRMFSHHIKDIADMFVQQSLLQKLSPLIIQIAEGDKVWKLLRVLTIIILNAIIIVSTYSDHYPGANDTSTYKCQTDPFFFDEVYCYKTSTNYQYIIFGILNILFASLVAFAYILDYVGFHRIHVKGHAETMNARLDDEQKKLDQKRKTGFNLKLIYQIMNHKFLKVWNGGCCKSVRPYFDANLMVHLLYIMFAVMGFLGRPWSCLCIVITTFQTRDAKRLLRIILANAPDFAVVFILMVSINYLFAVIAFFGKFFNSHLFWPDVNVDWKLFYKVFVEFLDQGSRGSPFSGDGEGGGVKEPSYGVNIYLILHNYIVILIIISILVGVVIDAFANDRDQEKEQLAARTEMCMVCGLEKGAGVLDETFHNHRIYRHSYTKYSKLYIHLNFTLDEDPDTASEKVRWFQFDNRLILRTLQRQLEKSDPSFIPSSELHGEKCTSASLVSFDEHDVNLLNDEFLINNLWDISFPPNRVEEVRKKKAKEKEKEIEKEKQQDWQKRIEQTQNEVKKALMNYIESCDFQQRAQHESKEQKDN